VSSLYYLVTEMIRVLEIDSEFRTSSVELCLHLLRAGLYRLPVFQRLASRLPETGFPSDRG